MLPQNPKDLCVCLGRLQGLSPEEYEVKKEAVADALCERLEKLWPGLRAATEFREVCRWGRCREWFVWV